MLLHNDAAVMHVLRKFVAAMLALSLLLISAVPMVSATVCAMPGMNMAGQEMQIEPVSPLNDGQDCYIECGCRVDNHLDGMPHQLAPHTLSLDSFDSQFAVNRAITHTLPVFTSRLLLFPSPPPRSI